MYRPHDFCIADAAILTHHEGDDHPSLNIVLVRLLRIADILRQVLHHGSRSTGELRHLLNDVVSLAVTAAVVFAQHEGIVVVFSLDGDGMAGIADIVGHDSVTLLYIQGELTVHVSDGAKLRVGYPDNGSHDGFALLLVLDDAPYLERLTVGLSFRGVLHSHHLDVLIRRLDGACLFPFLHGL